MKILVNFYFQRWKEKIEMKKLYPFLNWNVLCMLNDEKCVALLRIIEAGHGKAIKFNNKIQFSKVVILYCLFMMKS